MKPHIDGTLRKRLFYAVHMLVITAMVLLLVPAAPTQATTPRVQPILLTMASERPEDTVGVIVQKTLHDGSLERLVASMGGAVTADLTIVNSFAAELPAGAVPALAAARELTVAGTFPLVPGLVGMGVYHALIGIVEAVITAVVLGLIVNARPDILERTEVAPT